VLMIFTGYDELAYFFFLGAFDTIFRLYSKTLVVRLLSRYCRIIYSDPIKQSNK